jgi:hypothetical protein
MTVKITPKSTQHTGMATSTEGSVAAWQVTFELDEDESLHAAISISLAGPPMIAAAAQRGLTGAFCRLEFDAMQEANCCRSTTL